MKYINFNSLDERVLYDKLDNGLEVFILNKKGYNSYEARFFTNFGGIDIEFKPYGSNKMQKMPTGCAHFLEHKMFEQKSLESVHDFYKKSGTYVNAFTNYEKTCYFIYGINNFEENLNYLLDFVQDPYLTDKNVEKEKGIIKEEALMNLDNPNRTFTETILKNSYVSIPYDTKVVGTIDDIDKITKEDLIKCYDTFYHPSNMKLIIVSPKKEEEVLKIVKENQSKKSFKPKIDIVRKKYNETEKVKKEFDVLKENVEQKRLCYTVKMKRSIFNTNYVEIYDSFIIYFSFLIGFLSPFNLELKTKGIIKDNISYNISIEKGKEDFLFFSIYASTDNEEEFIKLLEDQLNKEKCSEKEFYEFKKVITASLFYTLNTVSGTMGFLYNQYCVSDKIDPSNVEIEKNLDYDKFISIINKFDITNKSIVILEPKE